MNSPDAIIDALAMTQLPLHELDEAFTAIIDHETQSTIIMMEKIHAIDPDVFDGLSGISDPQARIDQLLHAAEPMETDMDLLLLNDPLCYERRAIRQRCRDILKETYGDTFHLSVSTTQDIASVILATCRNCLPKPAIEYAAECLRRQSESHARKFVEAKTRDEVWTVLSLYRRTQAERFMRMRSAEDRAMMERTLDGLLRANSAASIEEKERCMKLWIGREFATKIRSWMHPPA